MWSTSITSSSGTSGSKKRKISEKGNIQGDGLDVDNELINEIVGWKVAPQICGQPKFWVTESKNDLVIKKLKSEFAVCSNCDKFFSPI